MEKADAMEHGEGAARGRPGPLAVVLIGVSGCGKTTVGKRLAPSLDATFLEGDDYHPSANIAKMRAGRSLDDADRQPWLEKLGHAIADHGNNGRAVVAACSALRRTYRDTLAAAARRPLVFIHLTIPEPILAARLQARTQHFMPVSLLHSQLETLEPLQDGELGTEIAETGTAQQTVEAIRRWLHLHETGRLEGRYEKGRHRRPVPHAHLRHGKLPEDGA